MQLVARAREALGADLGVRAVYETPTLGALAARLDALRAQGPAPAAAPAIVSAQARRVSAVGGERLPLSAAQERLWFLERLRPGSAAYAMPIAYRLSGALDVAALTAALGEVVRRHEVLRTRYAYDGAPWQIVDPPGDLAVPLRDLSGLEPSARERQLRDELDADVRAPFDLSASWPLRAAIFRLAPDEHVLLLNIHHIAADGWSFGVLARELSALYAGQALPELDGAVRGLRALAPRAAGRARRAGGDRALARAAGRGADRARAARRPAAPGAQGQPRRAPPSSPTPSWARG